MFAFHLIYPGSITKSPDAASPQATKSDVFVIVAPSECDAAVVPLAARVTPVSVLLEIPV